MTPEPRQNIPFISDVLEPSAGHYVVFVRMPTSIAGKFPEKPWRTDISEIGLANKDWSPYKDHKLVEVQAIRGTTDLYWVFQKLPGVPWRTLMKGQESLIPAKYRRQVTTTRMKQDVDPDTQPSELTGDLVSSVVEHQEGTGKAIKVDTFETIDTNAEPLVGEEYGDIVTKTVEEKLVPEGTPADAGLTITDSVVSPTGDGVTAVKRTKRVKGGAWPNPVEQESGKEPNSPPAKYRDYVKRTRKTRKVSAIPSDIVLSGNEVGKTYKRETPDRVEETVIEEQINLKMDASEESIQQRPFVSIKTTSRPGHVPVLPPVGTGSSQLVYRNGDLTIYENTTETATARPGPAGVEKENRAYVRITTNKTYSTTPTITSSSGSARVVFNDGVVQVYEVSNQTAEPVLGPAGKEVDSKPYLNTTVSKSYTASSNVDGIGSTNLVYNDGTLRVYELSSIQTEGKYGDYGESQSGRPWGTIITRKRYSPDPNIGKNGESSIVHSDGMTTVYLVGDESVAIRGGSFVSRVEVTPLYTATTRTSYAPAPTQGSGISTSEAVYEGANATVFRNDVTDIAAAGVISYPIAIRYSIPPVLTGLNIHMYGMRNGGAKVSIRPSITEGYTGDFPGRVERSFSKTPTIAASANTMPIMRPAPISVTGALFSFSCEPTLHGGFMITEVVGTSHPVFYPAFNQFQIAPTIPQVPPSGEYLYDTDVQPYKDGFIISKTYITLP